jgi:hypothetical protein
MGRQFGRWALAWVLGSAGTGLVACDEQPGLFVACPLSQSILNACAEDAESTFITCVVERHPMCDERICASWEGSESFCSRPCDTDEECPFGSRCLDHQELGFCVPDDIPNTIER